MVRHCLDTSSPFGVVLIREGSEVAPRDGSRPQELAIAGVGTLRRDPRGEPLSRRALEPADRRGAAGSSIRERQDRRRAVPRRGRRAARGRGRRPGGRGGAGGAGHAAVRRLPAAAPAARRRGGRRRSTSRSRSRCPNRRGRERGRRRRRPTRRRRAAGRPTSPQRSASRTIHRTLSFLLTGIIQVEPVRKQALLEAPDAATRLGASTHCSTASSPCSAPASRP